MKTLWKTAMLLIVGTSQVIGSPAELQSRVQKTTTNVVQDAGVFYSEFDEIPPRPQINAADGVQQGLDLPRANIFGTMGHSEQFADSNLPNAIISGDVPFDGYAPFTRSNLQNAQIDIQSEAQGTFAQTNLTGATIAGEISGAYAFQSANLTQAQVTATIGDGMDGGATSFMGSNLTGATIQATFDTRPSFWDPFMFYGANLENSNLTGSTGLRASYFSNTTNLQGANFSGTGITRTALENLANPAFTAEMLNSITF